MMDYKGYMAKVELDPEAKAFVGRVLNIRDVLTFEGTTVKGLEKAFRDTVDDYLDWCAERGEKPEKPFRGNFRLRMPADLHRRASALAEAKGKSLNAFINDALKQAVEER
ncbi:MAG: type II toxin-antitoxin system HicB family antitoxin [Candidatus Hydrogenedentota bacterium]